MSAAVVSRAAQTQAIAEFLRAAVAGPSALIIEGEPGIGKTAFGKMGAELWAAQARPELARTKVPRNRETVLTPSERRVAELAASGMKNCDVASALFASPKTVEVNLARICRKLGIHSRAELGRHMTQPERND
jgi:DNA-binding NarL/FixJ family response regulator